VLLNSLFLYRAIAVREIRIDSTPNAFKGKLANQRVGFLIATPPTHHRHPKAVIHAMSE